MPRKPPRRFDAAEVKLLEFFAGIRLPEVEQAAYFGVSKHYFDVMIKKSDAAQNAVMRGRSKAASKVRETLYNRAVGRERQEIRDPRTGELKVLPAIEVNQRALEFWCRSQEGMKTTDVVELRDPDGKLLREKSDTQLDDMAVRVARRLGIGGRDGSGGYD